MALLFRRARPALAQAFDAAALSSPHRRAVQELGFASMTPVQEATFAPLRAGESVIARARTGTGKTMAFLLPTLERRAWKRPRAGECVIWLLGARTFSAARR